MAAISDLIGGEPEPIEKPFSLVEKLSSPVSTAFDILSYPGSVLRGVLAGKGLDAVNPFNWTTGRDLLDNWGIFPKGEGFDFSGLAAEFIDPFILVGSVTGLTKAGKALETGWNAAKTLKDLRGVEAIAIAANDTEKVAHLGEIIQETAKAAARAMPELAGKEGAYTADELAKLASVAAPSRAEQFAQGLRGISLSVPGLKGEIGLPGGELVDKAIKPILDPIKKFVSPITTPIAEKLGSLFDSKSKLPVLRQLEQSEKARFLRGIDESIARNEKEIEEAVFNLNADAAINGGPIWTEETAKSSIRFAQRTPLPEVMRDRLDNFLNNLEARRVKALENTDEKFAALIKAKPEDEQTLLTQWVNETTRKEGLYRARKADKIKRVDEAIAGMNNIPDVLKDIAKGYSDEMGKMLDIEKAYGINISQLEDIYNYYPHILSPEVRKFARGNKEFQTELNSYISTSLSPTKTRKMKGKTVEEVNAILEKRFGIKNAVQLDPVLANESRKFIHQIMVTRATNVQFAARELVEDGMSVSKIGRAKNPTKIPLADVFEKTHLTGTVLPNGQRVDWGLNAGASKIEKALAEAGYGKKWLDRGVFADLAKTEKVWLEPSKFLDYWDGANAIVRTTLTTLHPAYHGTNALGNGFSNFISGIGLNDWKDAVAGWRGKGEGEIKKLTDEFFTNNYGGQNALYRETLGKLSGAEKTIQDLPGIKQGVALNNANETIAKLAHYLGKRRQGLDPLAASASVKKYLFDHSELTSFEKQVMRRLVLFYSFARKNLPLAITETVTNKRAYLLIKGAEATLPTKEFVPDYVRNGGQVYLGGDTYADFRIPLFEANRFSGYDASQVAMKGLGQLVPQLKVPMELVSGKNFFTGEDLPNLVSNSHPLALTGTQVNETTTQISPAVLEAMRSVPGSRLAQTAEDFFNPNVYKLPTLLGVRTKMVDPQLQQLKIKEQNIKRLLEDTPGVRRFTDYYSIADDKSFVNALNKELYNIHQQRKSLLP